MPWGKIEDGWVCLNYVNLDAAVSNSATTKTVVADCLRIRSAAGLGNWVVGFAYYGANLTIYETANVGGTTWGRCDKGWVCLTYVDLVPASGNGAVDARVVQYGGLNIREGAGTGFKSVGTYSKGTVVDIYEFSGNWGRTDRGWVCLDYLLT